MAVYNGDDLDRSFGAYVLISLILHAMLFFVFPRWDFAVGPGLFAGPGGGIISVVPIEVQQPARTQVTRQQPQQQTPNRQTATPAKQEPEPVETAKTQVTQTQPEAAPKPQDPTPPPQEDVKAADTRIVPEQQPATSEQALAQPDRNGEQVLTSEHGQEAVMAAGNSADAGETSSSNTSAESGLEEERTPQPPPLPPLPAASTLVSGGGRIQYPKNAINEGLAGTVKLEAYVPKGSTRATRIDIIQSSGTASLDEVARLTIQNGWRMEPLLEDYILSITVSFSGPPDFRVSIMYDGVRYVRNE